MKGNGPLHSSESDEWLTPLDLFERLNAKWNFTLDPCATPQGVLPFMPINLIYQTGFNPKQIAQGSSRFFALSGLEFNWANQRVFCNPPYSAISDWVAKAHSHRHDAVTVMLIPSRTDTKYWHQYIQNDALRVEFLPGRLKFRRPDGGKSTSAPFPSCLVYF